MAELVQQQNRPRDELVLPRHHPDAFRQHRPVVSSPPLLINPTLSRSETRSLYQESKDGQSVYVTFDSGPPTVWAHDHNEQQALLDEVVQPAAPAQLVEEVAQPAAPPQPVVVVEPAAPAQPAEEVVVAEPAAPAEQQHHGNWRIANNERVAFIRAAVVALVLLASVLLTVVLAWFLPHALFSPRAVRPAFGTTFCPVTLTKAADGRGYWYTSPKVLSLWQDNNWKDCLGSLYNRGFGLGAKQRGTSTDTAYDARGLCYWASLFSVAHRQNHNLPSCQLSGLYAYVHTRATVLFAIEVVSGLVSVPAILSFCIFLHRRSTTTT